MKQKLEEKRFKIKYLMLIMLILFGIVILNVLRYYIPSSGGKAAYNIENQNVDNGTIEKELGKIEFDKVKYTCKSGTSIWTKISASGVLYENDYRSLVLIESFSSSDISVATIEDHPYIDLFCDNCRLVLIKCKNSGTTILSAVATSGVTKEVELKVSIDLALILLEALLIGLCILLGIKFFKGDKFVNAQKEFMKSKKGKIIKLIFVILLIVTLSIELYNIFSYVGGYVIEYIKESIDFTLKSR